MLEVMSEAKERVSTREKLRVIDRSVLSRVNRIRARFVYIVQATIGAALAYWVAGDVVGHPQPFFAPISAVIILGMSGGDRMKKALEMSIGGIIGVAVGVYTASRQYKTGDRIWQGISIIAMNTHVVVASIAVVWGALKINELSGKKIFYVVGSHSLDVEGFFPKLVDSAQHLILPTISLVFISYASYHMTQRTLLLDNLDADYVRTARAKGLTRQQAIRKHALRTSIIPVATSVAFSIPGIFTGAVMTERIFGWNGMGQYFIENISKNDVNGAAAVAAFGAAMTAISAVLADLVVVALDPRVRVS